MQSKKEIIAYLRKAITFLEALRLRLQDDQIELHKKVRSLANLELQVKKQIVQIEQNRGTESSTFGGIYRFLQRFEQQCQILNNTPEITTEQIEQFDASIDEFIRDIRVEIDQLNVTIDPSVREKRIAQLKEWSFPVEKYPKETEFLVNHFEDCEMMEKVAGESARVLFRYGLPAVAEVGLVNERYWPGLVEMAKAAGESSGDLFYLGFPAVAKLGLINEHYWPELVEMAKAAGEGACTLFINGLPTVAKLGLVNERYWLGLVEMAKAAGISTGNLFCHGLFAVSEAGLMNEHYWPVLVKTLPEMAKAAGESSGDLFEYGLATFARAGLLNERYWPVIVKTLPEMAKAAGKNAEFLFEYGLPAVAQAGLVNERSWDFVRKKLVEYHKNFKGAERDNWNLFPKRLCKLYGIDVFPLILDPVIKSQTVASFLCFEQIEEMAELGALQTPEDAKVLTKIITQNGRRAADILKNLLVPIVQKKLLQKPLATEKDCLLAFLKESPVMLPELFKQFKDLYYNNPNREAHAEQLFKHAKVLIKDIRNGSLSQNYDQHLVTGVLYSVFSPELSIDRQMLETALNNREDRDSDIPREVGKLKEINVKISKGSYVQTDEINTDAWNIIVNAVTFVNQQKPTYDYAKVGLELLTRKFDIQEKHQQLYSFFTKTGESLPAFSNERETLLKYKEYTGDRLKNDVILQVLELAQNTYPNEFAQLNQSQTDYTKLVKTIMQPWNKNAPNKEQIVLSIFQRNHIPVEQLNWPTPVSPQIVLQTIQQATAGGIKKELVAEIFGMLCGKEYSAMQTEMKKFKFKSEGFGFGGDSFTFVLSKKKLHSVAMFNMGICVAPDDKLWNQPDMWQLIIFDKDGYAHGGCIIRTIIDNNKPYLVLSIQPATSLTGSYSSKHIYNKIIQYARTLKKQLKYEGVLIPKSAQIHSNRSSIQERISQARYPEFTSLKKHLFSDYHSLSEPYSYQNFYLV